MSPFENSNDQEGKTEIIDRYPSILIEALFYWKPKSSLAQTLESLKNLEAQTIHLDPWNPGEAGEVLLKKETELKNTLHELVRDVETKKEVMNVLTINKLWNNDELMRKLALLGMHLVESDNETYGIKGIM